MSKGAIYSCHHLQWWPVLFNVGNQTVGARVVGVYFFLGLKFGQDYFCQLLAKFNSLKKGFVYRILFKVAKKSLLKVLILSKTYYLVYITNWKKMYTRFKQKNKN